MDIYSYLKQDHQKVNKLLEEIEVSDVAQQTLMFEEIMEELLAHTDAEEKTFYQALKNKSKTKDIISHSFEEHDEVKKILNQLSSMTVRDAEWKDLLMKLKEAVQHHVKEEEEEIFPKAKEILDEEEAESLAKEMQQLKKEEQVLPIE